MGCTGSKPTGPMPLDEILARPTRPPSASAWLRIGGHGCSDDGNGPFIYTAVFNSITPPKGMPEQCVEPHPSVPPPFGNR